ncbi:hypothetical protein FOA52_000697 [Chlamydomonas sp. UWO 241]|nr:hypothetical protein FOA52_000697 [Chlamydomonas sp. UWO 241]
MTAHLGSDVAQPTAAPAGRHATAVALLDSPAAGVADGIAEQIAEQKAKKKTRRGDNKAAERTQGAWARGTGGNSRLRSHGALQQYAPKAMQH